MNQSGGQSLATAATGPVPMGKQILFINAFQVF
jgi:hypothetical protein